ncbi:MAG: winged helix DNA-binding domain-containing protein, partial [Actinobacteria bacterium]|nr:winged helix DNA-binding domain-containing protein [Actinomycetota bacterium]
LTSHGPATREEFARWWGFFPPEAGRVIALLGGEVARLQRAGEVVYLLRRDLRALERAKEDDEVRLLGMFDPYTLAGLPHEAVVPKAWKGEVYRPGAWVSQVVLRGGRVGGVWTYERKPAGAHVTARLFDGDVSTKSQLEESLIAIAPYIGKVADPFANDGSIEVQRAQ